MHPKTTLNPWAIATLACLCFLFVAADSIGPNVPSLFSRIISTNKTADAWRGALSVPSAASLTTVSNAQVATAGNLVTVSNAQVTTAGNLVTVSNAQVATAANLVTVSNAQVATAANLVTVSNAQVTTAANLVTTSNALQTALDTKPTVALTNLMLLNASNTPTGTNTLNMASLKASGAVSVVLLATNLAWVGDVTGSASTPSPWSNAAQVATFTMPPVIGNNGFMRFTRLCELTNSVAAAVYPVFYGGSGDGFLGAGGATGTSAVTNYNSAAQLVFAANGSSTNQTVNAGGAQSATWTTSSSVVDTSTNWTLKLGLSHSSGAGVTSTNVGLKTFIVEWVFGP